MTMRAPAFWAEDGLLPRLMAPLGGVTAWLTARRVAKPGVRVSIPVFCCGNPGVGGAGKTTLALDLLGRLANRGASPHALLRGYGGTERGPLRVQPTLHNARQVGDEALLLAEVAPTWVSADRAAGARGAVEAGASAIVMDDGLQNPGLVKDCSFLVIDGGAGFGNGHLLPAGPLREPVAQAAARCQAAVLIGADLHDALCHLPPGLPVLRASLVPEVGHLDLSGQYVAFAGIGRPEKFFAGLRAAGLTVSETRAFPDHHRLSLAELASLRASAGALDATLLTTPKDLVRLPLADRVGIAVAGVALAWEDEVALDAMLGRFLP
jgi:tetraacyldisaccharide 4'-kinase